MDRKKLVLLIGALIVAIATAFLARSLFTGAAAPQAGAAQIEPSGPKVLVAQRALPVGTIISADAVAFQAWPTEMVQDAYFIDGEADVAKLIGTVVRFPLTAGEPVTQGSLVAPDRLRYQFRVEDPGVYSEPWGGEYEFAASDKPQYEYACHEGNYALEGILAGARQDEKDGKVTADSGVGGGE